MKRICPHENPYGTAFNAGRLNEAGDVLNRMVDDDATICLTMAGALTPAGLGGLVISLIRRGLVDVIMATGANLYHDLHFALDLPVYRGTHAADDRTLQEEGIVRIYDVFIPFDTLFATDRYLQEHVDLEGNVTSAEIHHHLGQKLLQNAPRPEHSMVAAAAQYDVPIYCPSPGDSSIGMNLACLRARGVDIRTDTERDVLETAALIYRTEKSGAGVLGGGAPKNFFMQTQPMLSQILQLPERGHDYFVQITADAPHWGGLSGATSHEAISWNKIDPASTSHVTVYGDCTVLAPLLFKTVADKKREGKRLYAQREPALARLLADMGH
jgi:deoxyhypusine synthase